jgi:hypothetical protein
MTESKERQGEKLDLEGRNENIFEKIHPFGRLGPLGVADAASSRFRGPLVS